MSGPLQLGDGAYRRKSGPRPLRKLSAHFAWSGNNVPPAISLRGSVFQASMPFRLLATVHTGFISSFSTTVSRAPASANGESNGRSDGERAGERAKASKGASKGVGQEGNVGGKKGGR